MWSSTYLVCHYVPARCSCICCNDNAALEQTSHDGGSRAGSLGERHALCVQRSIAVVVGEVEAGQGVWMWAYVGVVEADVRRRGTGLAGVFEAQRNA